MSEVGACTGMDAGDPPALVQALALIGDEVARRCGALGEAAGHRRSLSAAARDHAAGGIRRGDGRPCDGPRPRRRPLRESRAVGEAAEARRRCRAVAGGSRRLPRLGSVGEGADHLVLQEAGVRDRGRGGVAAGAGLAVHAGGDPRRRQDVGHGGAVGDRGGPGLGGVPAAIDVDGQHHGVGRPRGPSSGPWRATLSARVSRSRRRRRRSRRRGCRTAVSPRTLRLPRASSAGKRHALGPGRRCRWPPRWR